MYIYILLNDCVLLHGFGVVTGVVFAIFTFFNGTKKKKHSALAKWRNVFNV